MTSLLALVVLTPAVHVEPKTVTIEVDGVKREATVYPPRISKEKGGAPLVFGFHGHGGNMRNAARSFQMHDLWPEAIVVYPQGLPSKGSTDPQGVKPGWQQNTGQSGDRDMRFFDALLKKVEIDYMVDKSRIYSMGHSNGGRFTNVLWAARRDVFAAFGISGSFAAGLFSRMTPAPAFFIAGETDPLVPFQNQRATMEACKKMNQCAEEGNKEGLLTTYASPTGNDIAAYIHGGGHEYPRVANALMVEFFKKHVKK